MKHGLISTVSVRNGAEYRSTCVCGLVIKSASKVQAEGRMKLHVEGPHIFQQG